MSTLDLHNFNIENRSEWDGLIASVMAGVKSPARSSLIRNFGLGETNERLIQLAKSLCRIYQEPSYPNHPLENDLVFRVEARGQGIRDARNIILYSTTSSSFPCHTDGSGKRKPYDILILHCIRQDSVGGDSIVLPLDEICARLEPHTIRILKEPTFPVPFGLSPILWEENKEHCIRYNLEELYYYSNLHGILLSEAQERAIQTLKTIIMNLEEEKPPFRLAAGDCLVIDNKRALHGRTALAEGSKRLLKRMRGYLYES
jgi:hypothetical protein